MLRGFGPPAGCGGFTPRLAFSPDGSRIAANAMRADPEPLGPRAGLGPGGRTRGRRPRGLAAPEPRPGRTGRRRGRRGRRGAGPRHPGRRRVPLDRARRVALSPRRLCPAPGTPWPGPWRPCPTTPGAGSTSVRSLGAPRLDGGVGDGAGEGPVPLRAAALPRPRRRGGRRGPGRGAPGCRRIPGLDHPPARRDDLRRGRHADPAARRLGPGRRPESRRRHLHGRGRDRPGRDHRIAARGHPRPEPAAPRARTGCGQRQLPPGRDPLERGHRTGRSRSGPGPPVPGLRRLLGSKAGLHGRERHPRHGPDHLLVDLAGDAPTSLGHLPDRPTDRDGCRHEVTGGAGLPDERPHTAPRPVPPVGHEPAVPVIPNRACRGSRPTRSGMA